LEGAGGAVVEGLADVVEVETGCVTPVLPTRSFLKLKAEE